jgi:hypothetical protein
MRIVPINQMESASLRRGSWVSCSPCTVIPLASPRYTLDLVEMIARTNVARARAPSHSERAMAKVADYIKQAVRAVVRASSPYAGR